MKKGGRELSYRNIAKGGLYLGLLLSAKSLASYWEMYYLFRSFLKTFLQTLLTLPTLLAGHESSIAPLRQPHFTNLIPTKQEIIIRIHKPIIPPPPRCEFVIINRRPPHDHLLPRPSNHGLQPLAIHHDLRRCQRHHPPNHPQRVSQRRRLWPRALMQQQTAVRRDQRRGSVARGLDLPRPGLPRVSGLSSRKCFRPRRVGVPVADTVVWES